MEYEYYPVPTYKFTKASNDFLTETTGVTAMIDRARNIIWFPLGQGITAESLSELNPTITNVTNTLKIGISTDFLAPQIYTLTIGGVTEDYKVQVQPTSKTELESIVNEAVKTTKKGSTANLNFIDTSRITDMSLLFYYNTTFNGDISEWDTSSITTMRHMFEYATIFNGNISFWDTSSVDDMQHLFKNTSFNGDITEWDVSSVNNMHTMFYNATLFNQDLSSWDVRKVTNHIGMFEGASAMLDAHKPNFN